MSPSGIEGTGEHVPGGEEGHVPAPDNAIRRSFQRSPNVRGAGSNRLPPFRRRLSFLSLATSSPCTSSEHPGACLTSTVARRKSVFPKFQHPRGVRRILGRDSS